MKIKGAFIAGVAVASLAVAGAASANRYFLTSDHCTGSCGTAPYGWVDVVTGGANTLDFTVTLINGNEFVHTGFDLSFAFDLAGNPTITYTNLTGGWSVVTSNPQAAGSYSQDGTGTFEYGVAVNGQGGGQPVPPPLHFDITAAGLTLASLEQNANGNFFAADIISGQNGNSGNVDASVLCTVNCGDITVPEPGSLALLAIGMLAVAGSRRLRKGVTR